LRRYFPVICRSAIKAQFVENSSALDRFQNRSAVHRVARVRSAPKETDLTIRKVATVGWIALPASLLLATVAIAQQQQVSREQDIIDLRLGQRVLVDDGSCPAGQIKEVAGAKMTSTGVTRSSKCIPRLGPKRKQ